MLRTFMNWIFVIGSYCTGVNRCKSVPTRWGFCFYNIIPFSRAGHLRAQFTKRSFSSSWPLWSGQRTCCRACTGRGSMEWWAPGRSTSPETVGYFLPRNWSKRKAETYDSVRSMIAKKFSFWNNIGDAVVRRERSNGLIAVLNQE